MYSYLFVVDFMRHSQVFFLLYRHPSVIYWIYALDLVNHVKVK